MHILIAETRKNVRSAIRLLLELQTESFLIGEVETIDELMEYITFNCPDVIILDWDLRELDASLISRYVIHVFILF